MMLGLDDESSFFIFESWFIFVLMIFFIIDLVLRCYCGDLEMVLLIIL